MVTASNRNRGRQRPQPRTSNVANGRTAPSNVGSSPERADESPAPAGGQSAPAVTESSHVEPSHAEATEAPRAEATEPSDAAEPSVFDTGDGGLALVAADGTVLHRALPRVTDSLRYMLARVGLKQPNPLPTAVGVISAVRGEGVTFVSRSLGLVLAFDYGKRVCLVDLNWAHPSNPDPDEPGVAQIVVDGLPLAAALRRTAHPGLDLLAAGVASAAQRPVIAKSQALADLLSELSRRYDHVILDLPAALATSEGLIAAHQCDGLLLVVRQGSTPETQISEAIAELGNSSSILGIVLNAVATKAPRMVLRRLPSA